MKDNLSSNTKVQGDTKPSLNRFIFSPIAMPLLVGAGSIGYVSILSSSIGAIMALFVTIIVMILTCSTLIVGTAYLCNKTLLIVLERLFGMILVMMAIQSLLTGIKLFVHTI